MVKAEEEKATTEAVAQTGKTENAKTHQQQQNWEAQIELT